MTSYFSVIAFLFIMSFLLVMYIDISGSHMREIIDNQHTIIEMLNNTLSNKGDVQK